MAATAQRITTPSPRDRYQRRLGAGLTPQSITAAQREADLGRMAMWADLLDEVRQGDPHLHGDLAAVVPHGLVHLADRGGGRGAHVGKG